MGKDDIYAALKAFKKRLKGNQPLCPKIYFCKVDIKACYDSLDQTILMKLIDSVIKESEYTITNYTRLHILSGKVWSKYRKTAENERTHFKDYAESLAQDLNDIIFVDGVNQSFEEKNNMLQLLKDHICNHIVKVGKRFFKQISGIPQGSVLSTVLCSLYYGQFENDLLTKFMTGSDSCLIRYVDDFLFMTTDKRKAEEFVCTIHQGKILF